MRKAWRDALPMVLGGGVGVLLLAGIQRTNLVPVVGPRILAGAVLVLVVLGGALAVGAGRGFRHAGPMSKAGVVAADLLGVTALVTGVVAVVGGSAAMLTALIGSALALWLVTAVLYAFVRSGWANDRDLHRLIDEERKKDLHG